MKKCSNCGMQLRDEDVFCSGCGRKYVEEIDYSFYGTPKRVIEEREEAERIERDEDVAFYGEATKRPEVVFEICKGVVCPICKGPICEGDVFCINCGSKVESVSEASAKEEPDKKYCMNCGSLLNIDDIFCMNCGAKAQTPAIEKEPAPKEPVIIKESQEAIQAEPIAAEPIIEEPAKKYCMNCGTPLSTDDVFCMNCGAKAEELTEEIKAEPIIEEPAPVAIPEAEKKAEDRVSSECGIRVCAKCGAKIESGYNFCIMCGSVCDIPASNESSCVNGEK
ncbi:MAG: zinc-ribbon domain-containing protein, partial [Christensenellaceae bacterium]|nr:zinc-ribbon domain-containing protein [Christensenellaceae bacterium]